MIKTSVGWRGKDLSLLLTFIVYNYDSYVANDSMLYRMAAKYIGRRTYNGIRQFMYRKKSFIKKLVNDSHNHVQYRRPTDTLSMPSDDKGNEQAIMTYLKHLYPTILTDECNVEHESTADRSTTYDVACEYFKCRMTQSLIDDALHIAACTDDSVDIDALRSIVHVLSTEVQRNADVLTDINIGLTQAYLLDKAKKVN